MKTPASIAKHPIHPMLVAFPIGLWVFSFICDVVYRTPLGSGAWLTAALFTLIGGIAGALAAAVPGMIDYFTVKNKSSRIKKIGAFHMILNLVVVALYGVNAFIRLNTNPASDAAFVLSLIAVLTLGLSGWLGAELIYVEKVSVDTEDRAVRARAA